MLTDKASITRRHLNDLLACVLGTLFIAAYALVLIPYFSNGINEYSDYALTIGAHDYYDPDVAQGPDSDVIYGSEELGTFALWYASCTPFCLFVPLVGFQVFTLLKYWSNFSGIGKGLRVALLLTLLAVGILGALNSPKFTSWMEL